MHRRITVPLQPFRPRPSAQGLSVPALALAAALALLAVLVLAAPARAQFQLGFQDDGLQQPVGTPEATAAYNALRAVNGSIVRVNVSWAHTAPAALSATFQPTNPADPHYDWAATDAAVRTVAAEHASPMLMLFEAPSWAEGPGRPSFSAVSPGAWDPNPSEFAAFATAAARRYSGTFPDPLRPGSTLPRVKLWEIWNEENLPSYLDAPDLVDEYRALLNAAYPAIKAVAGDNTVAVGGLGPVSYAPPASISALTFETELFCLRQVGSGYAPSTSCPAQAQFDAFADHPYSLAATPTLPAVLPGDTLVADIGKVAAVLHAADRLGTVAPKGQHQLWVTEFAWFTYPPDTQVGDSQTTAARYVAYSMYEMWRAGTQIVIWQVIRDYAGAIPSGGGVYTISGAPKLTLYAYAFPFIAAVRRGRGLAWGRAPVSRRIKVVIQRRRGRRWVTVARTRTRADGVFLVHFPARGNGLYRARLANGRLSLAYNSRPIPAKRTHLVNPV